MHAGWGSDLLWQERVEVEERAGTGTVVEVGEVMVEMEERAEAGAVVEVKVEERAVAVVRSPTAAST